MVKKTSWSKNLYVQVQILVVQVFTSIVKILNLYIGTRFIPQGFDKVSERGFEMFSPHPFIIDNL